MIYVIGAVDLVIKVVFLANCWFIRLHKLGLRWLLASPTLGDAGAGDYSQNTPQVRPCRLGRDFPVAHGSVSNHPPQR